MKRLFAYLGLYLILSSQLYGQRNKISVDSLTNLLPGTWNGIVITCQSVNKDSISLRMVFQDSSFSLTRIKGNKIVSEDRGIFKIDSVYGGSYSINVLLDKKYPEYPYNALSIGLQVIDQNKVQLSIIEAVHHKGTFHTRRYTGEYQFFREFIPEQTR